jgi:hypothetical protein
MILPVELLHTRTWLKSYPFDTQRRWVFITLLAPKSRSHTEKQLISYSRNYPSFIEQENSLPYVQHPTSGQHPELNEYSSHQSILFLHLLNIIIECFNFIPGLPRGLLHSGFPTKTLYLTLSFPMRATRQLLSHSPRSGGPKMCWTT